MEKLFLKFIWKGEHSWIVGIIFHRKNRVEEFNLLTIYVISEMPQNDLSTEDLEDLEGSKAG